VLTFFSQSNKSIVTNSACSAKHVSDLHVTANIAICSFVTPLHPEMLTFLVILLINMIRALNSTW